MSLPTYRDDPLGLSWATHLAHLSVEHLTSRLLSFLCLPVSLPLPMSLPLGVTACTPLPFSLLLLSFSSSSLLPSYGEEFPLLLPLSFFLLHKDISPTAVEIQNVNKVYLMGYLLLRSRLTLSCYQSKQIKAILNQCTH